MLGSDLLIFASDSKNKPFDRFMTGKGIPGVLCMRLKLQTSTLP
jgi:hypothetical protein